ncbi:MAG: zf-HC2 domain-containing protein [Chloroflexota bacterium]|nr:zf-HC2 domain-containing protein [Chloroflexota bacterium]
MNCKDVERELFDYLDDTMSPCEQEAVKSHLSICTICRQKVEDFALTQQELRQGLTGFVARASPSPHNWAIIEARLAVQKPNDRSLLEQSMARIRRNVTQVRYRPLYQKVIAGLTVVAIVVTVCLTAYLPQGHSNKALATELAREDPGLRVMMQEEGFSDLASLETAVVEVGREDMRYVHFIDPETHMPLAVVAVNTKDRSVLSISINETTENLVLIPSLEGSEPLDRQYLLDLARDNPEVGDILDAGAVVTGWCHYTSSRGEEVIAELRLDEAEWLLNLSFPEGSVKGLYKNLGKRTVIVND